MKRKVLAVGIILLFVGIAVVPSINANNRNTTSDGDLVVVVQTDKLNYQMGEPVVISIYVENRGDEDVTTMFGTSQRADYWFDSFYLWSGGKVFLYYVTNVTIPRGGRVFLLNDTFTQGENQVGPGLHRILGWMVETSNYPIIYADPVYFRIGTEMNIEVHGGIGVTVSMTNIGIFNATDVTGEVSIRGGIFHQINLSKSYGVDTLEVNESISRTYYPFGFGPVTIEIIASASNAQRYYMKWKPSIILFLVYPIIPSYEIMEVNQ